MKNLSAQIQSEPNPEKQNLLIARQNDLLSYMSGLSIAVGTTDRILIKRLKSVMSPQKK